MPCWPMPNRSEIYCAMERSMPYRPMRSLSAASEQLRTFEREYRNCARLESQLRNRASVGSAACRGHSM